MAESTKHDEEIAALRTDIETLRSQVQALDEELRRAQGRVDLTMKGQLRCRACSGRKIAHVPKVLDRGESDSREEMALFKPSFWRGRTVGKLEAYVCMGCGLVEWWVGDPGTLEPHPEFLHVLDGEPPGSKDPYR